MAVDGLDRETVREIVVSAVGVGVFFVAVFAIGALHAENGLGPQGGFALVGAIVGFIVLMAVIGVLLNRAGT